MQTKKTAPFDAPHCTKQADAINHFDMWCNCNSRSVHVRWPAKNSGAFVFGCPFLCFFLLGKQKKEMISALYRNIFKLPYFLCLEAKKVTKKIQEQTNGSARLSGPTHMKSHYNLKTLLIM